MTTMRPFTLGSWRVEPASGTLSSGSIEARLEPRVMSVLCLLAWRQGEVVSQGEILDTVWESRFVGANTLAQAIHQIRKVLGDSAREPRYLETIHKRGYRLIREVDTSGRERSTPLPEKRGQNDPRSPLDSLVDRLERALAAVLRHRSTAPHQPDPAEDRQTEVLARSVAGSIVEVLQQLA